MLVNLKNLRNFILPYEISKETFKENKSKEIEEKLGHVSANKIEIIAYPNQCDDIEQILGKYQIPYAKTNATAHKNDCYFYCIICPSDKTNDIITELDSKIDTSQKINVITNQKIESTISEYLINSVNNEQNNSEKKSELITPNVTQLEVIITKVDSFHEKERDVFLMVLISAIVAFVGLVRNDVVIIIASMLISPLLSPITSVSLNSVLGRSNPFKLSVRILSKYVVLSIILISSLTFIISNFYDLSITDEMETRTITNPLILLFAIMLGFAAGLSIISSLPEIVAGIGIAAALMPPISVIGIGIGLGIPYVYTGASALLLSNIIGILLGTHIVFIVKKLRPRDKFEKQESKRFSLRNALVLLTLALILLLLQGLFSNGS